MTLYGPMRLYGQHINLGCYVNSIMFLTEHFGHYMAPGRLADYMRAQETKQPINGARNMLGLYIFPQDQMIYIGTWCT